MIASQNWRCCRLGHLCIGGEVICWIGLVKNAKVSADPISVILLADQDYVANPLRIEENYDEFGFVELVNLLLDLKK